MCDLRDWSPEGSGACVEEYRPSSSSSSSSDEPLIKAELLQRAEEVIQGIITQIQPNYISEERRRAVIDYVQRLIRGCLGCEVFPFGSVPLRTYLPDGDIDLTAMVGINVEEALANDVFAVLDREDQNPAAEFVVKDVQLIHAEVKLVKCIIQNIVVDISFNQLGGLCTLCFLEQVDRLIEKDHLFKRSIILIKAWCYYESRILGAHHGLISTYALETLVLYIFHLFHSSLNGPLAVLYKFLDYYSKFDWEKYCVSLNGPVVIASLPEIVVEAPEHRDGELLLSNDFLRECMEIFSVPSKGFGTNTRSFTPKNFNILDPLKENNNLGRSVSKGNFYRIRRAFCYGVQKLQKILSDQTVDMEYELREIFSNTLDRHGSGQRPDVQDPIPVYRYNGFGADTAYSLSDSCQEDHPDHDTEFSASNCVTKEQAHHGVTLHGEYQNAGISASEMTKNRFMNEALRSSAKLIPSLTTSDAEDFADNTSMSLNLHRDASDLPTSRSSISSNGASRVSPLSSVECPSPIAKTYYVPHLYYSQLSTGEVRNGDTDQEHIANSVNEMTHTPRSHSQETCSFTEHIRDENQSVSVYDVPSPVGSKSRPSSSSPLSWSSEEAYSGCPSTTRPISSNAASQEHGNSAFDLSGEYEIHMSSLQYGRWCYEYALGSQAPQISLPYVPQFSGKNPWERSVSHKQNVLSQINANGIIARRAFYPINSPVIRGVPFTIEEASKPRGTGTYFPNANHYRDRHPTGRGMNHGSVRSPRNNGRSATSFENYTDRARDFPQTRGKPGPSEFQGGGSPGRKSSHNYSSGSSHSSEKHFEFGSLGHHLAQLSESRRQVASVSVSPPGTSANMSMLESGPKTETGNIKDRTSLQSYHLKDEDDFPPLSESTGRG